MKWILVVIGVLILLAMGLGIFVDVGRGHWLVPHGRITCDGKAIEGAALYRSRGGDIFAWMPNQHEGTPGVSFPDHLLMRCNTPAFTPVFGLLFSREADPSSQCTNMWKGGGSDDNEPPHVLSDSYAEFPWGSCGKLRLDF